MHMSVVEAGEHSAPAEVYDPAVRRGEFLDGRGGSYGDDPVALDGDRFRLGLLGIFRPDPVVEENEGRGAAFGHARSESQRQQPRAAIPASHLRDLSESCAAY